MGGNALGKPVIYIYSRNGQVPADFGTGSGLGLLALTMGTEALVKVIGGCLLHVLLTYRKPTDKDLGISWKA